MRFMHDIGAALVPAVSGDGVSVESVRRGLGLEVADVGDEQPLPQQELAAREVVVPRRRPVPPGLRPLVVNAPGAHGHARADVGPRLECVAVKDEPVDSLAKRPIAERLDASRDAACQRSLSVAVNASAPTIGLP